MINLFDLCEKQNELDSHLSEWPDNDRLVCAINAELGELVQARKGNWCWWGRGREVSEEETLGELVDVLHFLLHGYNRVNDVPKVYHQALLDEHRLTDTLQERVALAELPMFITKLSIQNRYHDALVYWCDLAKSLGFSSQDIEIGYDRSVEKNLARWR